MLKTAQREVIHRHSGRRVQGSLTPGKVKEPTH